MARSQLSMAGGRSQAEKLLTKKQMFRELRGKLNEAAKIPGFFEVGQHVVSKWKAVLVCSLQFLIIKYCNRAG
jgi:hypothetical protein